MKSKCILCNESNSNFEIISKEVRDSSNLYVVKCPNCGHFQIYPIPEVDDNKEFYNNDIQAKQSCRIIDVDKIRRKAEYDTKWRYNLIADFITPAQRILDVGSGYGFFIEYLENLGYVCDGIEISESRRKIAKGLCNGNIYSVDILTENIDSFMRKYDVITLFHVLEHTICPVLFLKQLGKMLTPGGKLIIEVPNVKDHALKLSKSYRNFYWQRAHLSYFSPDSLKKAIESAGFASFEIYGRQRYGVLNLMNWLLKEKPQIDNPDYFADNLKWLEKYYKDKLSRDLNCDTLYALINV